MLNLEVGATVARWQLTAKSTQFELMRAEGERGTGQRPTSEKRTRRRQAHRQSARGLSAGGPSCGHLSPAGVNKMTSLVTPELASGVRSIASRTVPSF